MDQTGTLVVTAKVDGLYRRHGKRLFDLAIAVPALIIIAPVILAVGSLVKVMLGRPVIFCHARPGLHGKLFHLLKFRTMREAVDSAGNPLSDEQRLTRFGKFLRAASLDELPELWNILRGDMSFVGPRPLLVRYLDLYNPQQSRRHEVKPGLTGLAQVSGRNSISWEQKFQLDVEYVDNCSFWLDLQILGRTVVKVLQHSEVSAVGHATMPEFLGSWQEPLSEEKRAA